ncbi:MAG: hypothetical protein COB85_01210 [Bacteroidetes bacterium]|nr:MAG: hypothetical protein COB85_01210 [Bacteroidota bacterium]
MKQDFKYEVAFSFLADDEELAVELSDLISDRVPTFIYSKRQEELGGSDGEITFNNIFGKESRMVVVLFRDGWGETPWTRIEETAIRNRSFNEGWDFTIFILLNQSSTIPQYVPKAQIWVDYDRWGLKGAAPIIEQRVKESGGEVRTETVQDKADRLHRLKKSEQEREAYLRSAEALENAHAEFDSIVINLKTIKPTLEDKESRLVFSTSEDEFRYYEFGYMGFFLLFKWVSRHHVQFLNETKLIITIYQKNGHKPFDYEETVYFEKEYNFDRSLSGTVGWSDYHSGESFITSKQLIEYWISRYLDELEKNKIRRVGNKSR